MHAVYHLTGGVKPRNGFTRGVRYLKFVVHTEVSAMGILPEKAYFAFSSSAAEAAGTASFSHGTTGLGLSAKKRYAW